MERSTLQTSVQSTFSVVSNPSNTQQHRPSAMHNLYTTINCCLPSNHSTPTETLPSYMAVLLFLVLLLLKLKHVVEEVDVLDIPWFVVFLPLFASNVWSLHRHGRPLYIKYFLPLLSNYGILLTQTNSITSNRRGYEGIQEVNSGSSHQDQEDGVASSAGRIEEEQRSPSYLHQAEADPQSNNTNSVSNPINEMRESICKERKDMCESFSNVFLLLASFYAKIIALVCLSQSSIPNTLTMILLPAWICIILAISIKVYEHYVILPRLMTLNRLRQEYASPAWSSPFVLIMFTLIRGIQPLLISCQLDHSLERSWSVILSPLWIITFLGLAVALLLVSFLPYMNPHQSYVSSPLKVAGHKVGYLLAIQIALCSIWLFWSVLVIAERLDYHKNSESDSTSTTDGGSSEGGPDDNKGKDYSVTTIMTPIILIWITLVSTSPMLYSFTRAFEVQQY